MRWRKRIGAFLLMIVLLISESSSVILAYANEMNEPDDLATLETGDDFTIEGTNSFGNLLSNMIGTELDEQEENEGCNIFSIEMYDNVAEVSFETTEYASLVVGIYDEDGMAMLASGELDVMPGEETAYVDIDIDTMPAYYYVRGFLIDEESMRPLCSSYESSMYTQEMQEFLEKTTDDFQSDKVLNFDEDKTNNFAVYSEETIIIPQSEGYNIVTQNDVENNVYVIENIDSSISNLTEGDIFSYELSEGNILIVKVASISIDGTTATITGADTSMEEVFDYVKIDETSYTQDVSVDDSTCGEGVVYEGDVELTDDVNPNAPQTYSFDETPSVSYAKQFSFLDEKVGGDAKLSGSIAFQITAKIKLYISTSTQYLEVKLDYNIKLSVSFSGKMEGSLPLGYFGVSPVPGVFIKFTPSFVMSVSAKVDLSGQLYGTIGFRASAQEGMKNLTTTPQLKAELKGEITAFIGISMKPEITILTDNIANASLEATFGAEAKSTMTYSTASNISSASKKIHECTSCIDGDITGKASVSFKATIFHSDNLTFKLSKALSVKISDFYFSFDYGDCGFSSCPHYMYKTTFTVTDVNGKKLQNATIKIPEASITTVTSDGKKETVTELITDKDGKVECYLPGGKYNATIDVLGYLSSRKKIQVKDNARIILVFMRTSSGGDSGNNNDSTVRTGETLALSNLHSGAITEDGSLYMWGNNDLCAIGNGTNKNQTEPVKVLEHVVDVKLGFGHSGAITEDGSLYMWGYNFDGQVGNGTIWAQKEPLKVLEHVVDVQLGNYHSGAITEDGSLYMWGQNCAGQVGNGIITNQTEPVKVLEHVVDVEVGWNHNAAITEDGSLYMWGENCCGQVGNGTTTNQTEPVKVLEHVVDVELGAFHSGAITEDGSLYMWGKNGASQVGNGTIKDQTEPVKVLEHVVDVELGTYHSGAITEDGSLYMWGDNSCGQVGNGTDTNQRVPVKVLARVVDVELGSSHSGVITEDGSLYMWGFNFFGQVGNGTATDQRVPVKVLDHVVDVELGTGHSGAITEDGSLYMWGENEEGEIGNGSTENQLTPIKIIDHVKLPTSAETFSTEQIMSTNLYSAQLSSNGTVQVANFSALQPNAVYNLYVMKDKEAENVFSSSNLLYITQAISDSYGNLTISYEPTEQVEDADVFVVPMLQTDLSSAQIELTDLEYTGEMQYVNPVVKLDGNVLVAGRDYQLSGDYSALEEGEYTVTVQGIGLYCGEVSKTYKVKAVDKPLEPENPAPEEPDKPITPVNPTPEEPEDEKQEPSKDTKPMTPENGWYTDDNGNRIYFKDGRPLRNQWLDTEGSWYYLNNKGVVVIGWMCVDGTWYYFDSDGKMTIGWQKIDGTWYYLETSGAMLTGWQEIGGSWYYFYGDGSMAEKAWVDGYYLGRSGAWIPNPVYEGWMQSGSRWWYQYADGTYATSTWEQLGGTWYYFDASGWMATGWTFDGTNWYYMNSNGSMQIGWLLDGNTWYYLNPSGAMATGWIQDGGEWYLMDGSGAMQTGWVQQGEDWYYLYESGAMAHDTVVDGYSLNASGAWVSKAKKEREVNEKISR